MWNPLVIIISSLISLYVIYRRVPTVQVHIKGTCAIIILLVISRELIAAVGFTYEAAIQGALLISASSLILVLLLMVLHHLKPPFVRYPYPLVFLPLTIIISFPFIYSSQIIINIVIMVLLAGGIVVHFILWLSHKDKMNKLMPAIISTAAFFTAYIIFWFTGEMAQALSNIAALLTASGMILSSFSFIDLLEFSN